LSPTLKPIGLRQSQAHDLRLLAHLVVINRQTAAQDNLVETVQGRSTKVELLGKRGQRRGRGVGGNTQNDVVLRIDIFFQAHLAALGRDGAVGQIQVAATGDLISEEIATG
jgi:hypothetical protein